jgi:glucose/arabinose dehydrogenase
MWAAEFGQNTWDELNIIEPGGNYGWPEVEGAENVDGFINPVAQWATGDASPSGLVWTRDTFFLAALRGQRVWAVYANPESVDSVAWFAGTYGRIRDVIAGPDGTLWFLTNNTDGRGDPREGDDKIIQFELGELVEG